MKNFKSYEFQRTDSNKQYFQNKELQSTVDNFLNTNNSNNSNSNQIQFKKEQYEARISQLENRINELEKTVHFFEEYFKRKSICEQSENESKLDEIAKDIYRRLNVLETTMLSIKNLYRNYDIDQIVLDKFTPLKLSLNKNLNEIKIVINELSECNLRQDTQFQAIENTLDILKDNIDSNKSNINELNGKMSNILDIVGEGQSEEELFLKNIRK